MPISTCSPPRKANFVLRSFPLGRSRLGTKAVFAFLLFAGASDLQAATTIQIVADNDFALLVGTATGITRLIYQNEVGWDSQIAASSSFTFDLNPGEDTFYILAMGGGGAENISGQINGVNIANVSGVEQSSNLSGSLANYDLSSVALGSYDVQLSDVQGVFSSLSWFDPELSTSDSIPTVIGQNGYAFDPTSGYNIGYILPGSDAVLFRVESQTLGVSAVPETSSALAIGSLLGVGLLARTRRRES